jgi:hypothetical protein
VGISNVVSLAIVNVIIDVLVGEEHTTLVNLDLHDRSAYHLITAIH